MDKQKQIEEFPKPHKKILANKVYSNSTLKKWSKEELIEQIRILEHNWASAEESLNNSAKNIQKIIAELQKQVDKAWLEVGKMCMEERTNTAKEILELSKSTPTYCNFVKVVKERYGVDLL